MNKCSNSEELQHQGEETVGDQTTETGEQELSTEEARKKCIADVLSSPACECLLLASYFILYVSGSTPINDIHSTTCQL